MARGRCHNRDLGLELQALARAVLSERHEQGRRTAPQFNAEQFETVEVNGTFYRLIEVDTFRKWREETPKGLRLRVQGQPLSHPHEAPEGPRAGRGPGSSSGSRRWGDKLGPIVFQLPGRFKPDRERLAAFLDALPAEHRYAFEFRDPAWFQPKIFEALAKHNVALCLYEFAGQQAPPEMTASFVYIRLHGPEGRTGLLRRRGAPHLGQTHPRLGRERARRLLLLRQRRSRIRAEECLRLRELLAAWPLVKGAHDRSSLSSVSHSDKGSCRR